MLQPDINCCIYFMNVVCDFMDLIYRSGSEFHSFGPIKLNALVFIFEGWRIGVDRI